MIGNNTEEIIINLFSLLRYQIGLEDSMKGRKLAFDYVDVNCIISWWIKFKQWQIIYRFSRTAEKQCFIDSGEWLKNNVATPSSKK